MPGLDSLPLCPIEVTPVCAPALLNGRRAIRGIADLGQHTLLHGAPRPRDWERWFLASGVTPIRPTAEITFDTLNLAIQAAIEGLGVAVGIRALVGDDLAAGRLVQPFAATRVTRRQFLLVWPKANSQEPRLRAYIDWLAGDGV